MDGGFQQFPWHHPMEFRKNIIQLVIFLGIVTFLSSSQKYIPYTRQEIIVQDIVLFLLYLVLSIVIDIINEKKQG